MHHRLALLLPLLIAGPAVAQSRCEQLFQVASDLAGLRIDVARPVANDPAFDSYCLVQGRVNERTGIDGKSYAIGFEMRLPDVWSGRFLLQANGGNDGAVIPATGGIANAAGGQTALARGFAVLSTDAGHNGLDPVNRDAGIVAGNLFGLDPQARADYGYAATATMTPLARTLIERYYGRLPDFSYLAGCSNGGRHGMVAASRFPDLFDGILAGNPGFDLPRAAVQHAWDVQSFQIADPDIRKAFSREDMALVARDVVAACDALDGLADGLVADLRGCQETFRLESLICADEKDGSCLAPKQVEALSRSMAGPIDTDGQALYAEWPYDGGLGSGNWRFWKLESGNPDWNGLPLITTLGGGSLAYLFSTPPVRVASAPDSLLAFLSRFDFDTDAPTIYAADHPFSESAMTYMAPPDVDNPRLAGFKANGHKLIVYHGQSDGVFSTGAIVRWYEKLTANQGGDAGDFARLFLVPGMNHCGGGPATDQFDALSALVDWVEDGLTPDRLIATINPDNPEVPASWSRQRSRPLCVWPRIARYTGGDPEVADSFACLPP
jgi:feruloyl esterase